MQWPNLESASAAWGSDAQEMDCYQVFPAYICCLGPSFKEHQGDSLEKAPDWRTQAWLGPAFGQHLVTLSRVPVWEPRRPQSPFALRKSYLWGPNFGNFKQKPPAQKKWYADIHQVLLWIGSANLNQRKKNRRR